MKKHGPYKYTLKHGIGPGTLPKDVEIVKYKDLNNGYTVVYLDRFLTTDELEKYNIPSESGEATTNPCSVTVFESLTDDDVEKLSKYSLTEEELSYVLSLLELIGDDNKAKAFDLINALFSNKKLVPDDSEDKVKKSERYTRRLLGDI